MGQQPGRGCHTSRNILVAATAGERNQLEDFINNVLRNCFMIAVVFRLMDTGNAAVSELWRNLIELVLHDLKMGSGPLLCLHAQSAATSLCGDKQSKVRLRISDNAYNNVRETINLIQ